jgi:hypothetical protein
MNKAFKSPKLTYKKLKTWRDIKKRERMLGLMVGCKFLDYDEHDDFDFDQHPDH